MAFMDKLKAKAAELGLDAKAAQAKEKAAAAAGDNRDKIAQAVGKAGQTVDAKTGGKYSDQINKAQDAALKSVDKVAAQNGTTGSASTGGPLDSGDFGTSALATERAYDADLAGDAGLSAGNQPETATQRTVGQDGLHTADDQVAGESPIERAIGADATTSSLDPHTSFETGDAGARDVQNADVTNAPVTDPEINEIRRVGDSPRD